MCVRKAPELIELTECLPGVLRLAVLFVVPSYTYFLKSSNCRCDPNISFYVWQFGMVYLMDQEDVQTLFVWC